MIYCLCTKNKTEMDLLEDSWEKAILMCPKCKCKVEESG
jgi:hypothetical protein